MNLFKFDSYLVNDIDLVLQESMLSLKTWKYPAAGSESVLLDPHVTAVILNEMLL